MKFNLPLNNFGAGEWSPKMQSRTDAEQYPRSCKEVTNFLIQMQGGAQYRGGTSRGKVTTTVTPATYYQEAMDALLVGNTEPTKDFKTIKYVNSDTTKNTELVIFTSSNDDWFLSNGQPIVFDTPLTYSWPAGKTQYQQIGDYLFLVNGNGEFEPRVFYYNTTTGDYSVYTITALPAAAAAPWKMIPWDDIHALGASGTVTTNATITGTITLSRSPVFNNGDVGRYVRLCNGAALDGIARVVSVSGGVATCTVLQTIPNASFVYGSAANASSFWQMSKWGFGTASWPRTVTAFQGRLIYGGTPQFPDTTWGSRIANIFDFQEVPSPNTTGVYGFASSAFLSDNSRPFTLTPNTTQSSNIVAMSSAKTLNIHTDTAEIVAYGSNGALGPNNVVFESSTSFGASPVQPVRVNNYSTFVQANGYKIRDINYNFSEDQYKSQDLGFLAEHLFLRTVTSDISSAAESNKSIKFPVDDIVDMCRYESRSSLLLCLTRSGKLAYVTLDRDYSVNAWGRLVIGSETQEVYPYDNQPVVLAMCESGGKIIMLVSRTFDSVATVCIETLNDPWEYANNSNDTTNDYLKKPIYLDCSYQCTAVGATPTATWKIGTYLGAAFYPRATLSVVADGNYLGEITLDPGALPIDDEGNFTLPSGRTATQVYVGYKYPGVLTTCGIEVGGQYGSPVGLLKRVTDVVVKFYKTGSALLGKDRNSLEEFTIRPTSTPMNEPTPFFTGNKSVKFSQGYEEDYSITVVQDKPYPCYIVSVTANGMSDD